MLKYGTKMKSKIDESIHEIGQGYVQHDIQHYFINGRLVSESSILEHYEVVK